MAIEDLTADERAAIIKLLRARIAIDPYPLSPRIRRLKSAVAKLDPSSAPQEQLKPTPAPKPWVNSSTAQRNRRR